MILPANENEDRLLFASRVVKTEFVNFKYSSDEGGSSGAKIFAMVEIEDAGSSDGLGVYIVLPEAKNSLKEKAYRLRSSRGNLFKDFKVIKMTGSYLEIEFSKAKADSLIKFTVGYDIAHTDQANEIYISEE